MKFRLFFLFAIVFLFILLFHSKSVEAQFDPPPSDQPWNIYLPLVLKNYPLPKIAFSANWSGNYDIYVTDAEGSDWVNLTNDPANDQHPTWSPDGTKIAFSSNRAALDFTNQPAGIEGAEAFYIFVMNADGTGVYPLTVDDPYSYGYPDWSPDGQKIAYVSGESGTAQIYTINLDGTQRTRITFDEAFDWGPAWSPDGKKIAYGMSSFGTGSDIYIVNADGTNPTRLTYNAANEWNPDWSPDGKYIVFDSFRNGNSDLFIIKTDGSGEINLTQSSNAEMSPAWSSDGQWIAYSDVTPDEVMHISMINPDGSAYTTLPFIYWGVILDPAWGP